MKELIKKIKDRINLSSEAEEYLFSISKEKVIPKGSILIREGQVVNKIYFVKDPVSDWKELSLYEFYDVRVRK